jgi:hypothetical protein
VEAAGEPPAADVPRLLLPRGEGIPSAECGVGVSAVGFACRVFSIATYSVLSNRQRNKLMAIRVLGKMWILYLTGAGLSIFLYL